MAFLEAIPVLISITSNAHRDDETDEPMAMLTSGEMELQADGAFIHYEETLDESMPPQPVTLIVQNDTLTMMRGGTFETSMVFRKGYRYEGQYHTPYGDMDLAIYCTRLRIELTKDGGDISFSYQLDLNGQFAAMHDMELQIIAQYE